MTKTQSIRKAKLVLATIFLTSCSFWQPIPQAKPPTQGNKTAKAFSTVKPDILLALSNLESGEEIISQSFDNTGTKLRCFTSKGKIKTVDILTKTLEEEYVLSGDFRWAKWVKNGDLLITKKTLTNNFSRTTTLIGYVYSERRKFLLERNSMWDFGEDSIDVSPTGDYIAQGNNLSFQIIHLPDGMPSAITSLHLDDHEWAYRGIDFVVFDWTGQYLAIVDKDFKVGIYRVGEFDEKSGFQTTELFNGTLLRYHPQKSKTTFGQIAAFSPQRNFLAISINNELHIFNLVNGKLEFSVNSVFSSSERNQAISFDPTGRLLAVGSEEGLKIWDIVDHSLKSEWLNIGIRQIAFNSEGDTLALLDNQGNSLIMQSK